MATLADLRLAIFPAAAPLAPVEPSALEREVAWVRVLRARVPAFDALDAGDLAILPVRALSVIAPGDVELAAVLDALVAARASAILLVEPAAEPAPDWLIAAIGAALRGGSLPVYRVHDVDPTELERSLIGYLLNRRAELDHQAGLLETQLTELALGGAELDALVAATAGFFGRAIVLEGSRGDLLAVHAPPDAPGGAAAVAAYLAGSRAGVLRFPLPTSGEDRRSDAAGRLVLLGDRSISELERFAVGRVGRLLALELARSAAVRRAGDATRRETLPSEGPPWVVLVARQLGSLDAREAARGRVSRLGPRRRLALRGDAESLELRAVLAIPAGLGDIPPRVAEVLGRSVAVSRPFRDPLERPAAEAEARTTLEVIEGLPDPPPVAEAARLPAFRLLTALRALPDGRRQADALLAPLLTGSPEAQRERLVTLRAVLEHAGLAEAAEHLGVHRNTLAYRIRRLEALTGWRLADPDLRVPLLLAVRIRQLTDE